MRTKVKKLTSVILAVVMMLGILTIAPLTVSAATYGDFEYTPSKMILHAPLPNTMVLRLMLLSRQLFMVIKFVRLAKKPLRIIKMFNI